MMIAVDTSIVTYALRYAFASTNDDEVNYVCLRIAECVPQMQRTLCIWCLQDIDDYLTKNPEVGYLKLAPIKRLREVIAGQQKEFRK